MTSDEWNRLGKKLGQLRALARSASGDGATGSLDEARNAALAFCGLLDRHELQVLPRDAIVYPTLDDASVSASATAGATANVADAADLRERMARAKAKAGDPHYGKPASSSRRGDCGDHGGKESVSGDFPSRAEIAAERIRRGVAVLDSKYRGECSRCGKPYIRGEKIYWKRDKGAWHPQCWIEVIFSSAQSRPTQETKARPPPPVPKPVVEDDDFDGLHSIWGGSPMRSGKR
jgi:hypothetical protein